MATLLEMLLSNYKDCNEKELSDIVGLLTLDRKEIEHHSNITVKTRLGFQVAIELFAGNEKIDLIAYEEQCPQAQLVECSYSYSIFQYRRHAVVFGEEKYQIVVENRWAYTREKLVEEFDHDYYSLVQWKEKVLKGLQA